MRLFIGMCIAILVAGCQSNRSVQAPDSNAHRARLERLGRRPLDAEVAGSEVIVVATFVDSAEAKPKRPRDAAEMLWRFRVVRILKGSLEEKIITIQHPGSLVGVGVNEIVGKEWILLLSPEYMAGKHRYAGLYNIKLEPEVRDILQIQMP